MFKEFLDLMKKGRIRLAICVARQLGKTIAACILLIWVCWYNKLPVTINVITICYIVSRDDDTASEFLGKIRLLLYDGDVEMSKYGYTNFFSGSLKEPNNTEQITFLNHCFIKSIPPTKKALGKSASLLWIDEAHRLKCMDMDTDTFFDYASAMVAETGGGIVLSSSPEGQLGFFYRAIDPEGVYPNNEYVKVWFSWRIWDDDSDACRRYQSYVKSEERRLIDAGRYRYFQQEYEALFTVTESSFFDIQDIESAVKDSPMLYEYKDGVCSLGIDYGLKVSRTVLTVRTVKAGELIQLFQYRCPANFDTNLLTDTSWEHSVPNLKKRYNLSMIIVDDCPQGDSITRWLELNIGLEVKKYNFRSDQMSKEDSLNRNCVAYSYRAKLKSGVLKLPRWNVIQLSEMKTVEEVSQKILISIKSPQGQLCDTFDSDMMACVPFLDMQMVRDFKVDSEFTDAVSSPVVRSKWRDDSGFKRLSDSDCQELISHANQGLLE